MGGKCDNELNYTNIILQLNVPVYSDVKIVNFTAEDKIKC